MSSLQFRKVYALSMSYDFESHWIVFDISTQNWTVYANKVDFGWNHPMEFRGNLITVRGIHYFFHQLALSNVDSSPINIILENGTMVDLNIDRPFEMENGIQKMSLVPFYQRFSKLYLTKWIKIYLLLTLYLIQLIRTTNKNLEFLQWKDLWHKIAWGTFWDSFGFPIGKKNKRDHFSGDQNGKTRFKKKKSIFPKGSLPEKT